MGNQIGPAVRHDCLRVVDLRGSTSERDRSQWGLITVGRLCIAAFHEQYLAPLSFERFCIALDNEGKRSLEDDHGACYKYVWKP